MKEDIRHSHINHTRQHEVQHGITRDVYQQLLCVADHVDVNLRQIRLQGDFTEPTKQAQVMRAEDWVQVSEPQVDDNYNPRGERVNGHVVLSFLHQNEMKP